MRFSKEFARINPLAVFRAKLMNETNEFRAELWNDIEDAAMEARAYLGLPQETLQKTYVRDYFWAALAPPMNVLEYEQAKPYYPERVAR